MRLNTHFYAIRRMTLALIIKLQAAAVWVKTVLTSLIFILHVMLHVNHANFYTIICVPCGNQNLANKRCVPLYKKNVIRQVIVVLITLNSNVHHSAGYNTAGSLIPNSGNRKN